MFSQTTEYALRAMAWLALSPDELVPTITLAEKTQVPPHYLAKVLQQLSAAELVTGRRGVRGGYRLSRAATSITLMDVVRSIGTIERIKSCPLGAANLGSTLCPVHRILDQATKMVMELLDGKTLADLLSQPGAHAPLCDVQATKRVTLSLDGVSRSN
ncbi:MAG: Rrf2 family transcriptional regulator [Pyrinomonadaceae bacterium]|nr:Rrf2 family transcriptional regulator [Phycisphaerales bacterium]